MIVGEIRKPHGIKGELYITPSTDYIEAVFEPGRTLAIGDRLGHMVEPAMELTVGLVRPFKGGLIVRFEGIADRNAAENFRDRTLLVPRDEAVPLAEDEYYLHDLVGLEVRDESDRPVGSVREVYEVGTGYMLAVDDGTKEHMIPLDKQIVRKVDADAGIIVIAPPPGLLDL